MKTQPTNTTSHRLSSWRKSLTLLVLIALAGANAFAATSNPTLVSITVSPSSLTAPVGGTEQYTATGNYSDGSNRNLTSGVVWSSSVPSVATVSPTGLATVLAQGSTAISASFVGKATIASQMPASTTPPSSTGSSGSTSGSSSSPSPSQLPSGLILDWTFGAGTISGSIVTDASGSNLNGTVYGSVAEVAGQDGQALQFNGGNSSVQNYSAAPLNNSLTLSAWINTTNATRWEAIMARYNAAGPGTGYIFRTDPSGHLEVVFGGYNGGSISSPAVDKAIVNDGRWHHVAAAITIGQGVQFYVDGNATANVAAKIFAADGGTFNVGMNSYTPFGNYFTGSIDNVEVYSRVLKATEVASVYALSGGQGPTNTTPPSNSGSTSGTGSSQPSTSPTTTSPSTQLPSGLILDWTFHNGTISGSTVSDQSGANLNGTIHGSVAVVTGQDGQALHFNGGNSFVQNYSAAPLNNSLTLSAWINTTNTSRWEAIIARYNAAGPGTGYIFRTDPNGHLEVVFGGYNGGSISSPAVDTAIVNDGRWHHVAAVITLGQGVQFYVDGNATATIPAQVFAADGGTFDVGVNSYTPFGNYFTGSIDTVEVYNRALKATEVATVYALSNGQTSSQNQPTSTGPATSTTTTTQGSTTQTVATATPGKIAASPVSLSFGNVTVGAGTSQTIAVANSGASSVTVSNVLLSGPGFTASGLPVGTVLAPGQSVILNVTFTPSVASSVSGGVTVTSNASNSTLHVAFSGAGTQPAPTSFPVSLTWGASPSTGISGYKVYRGTSAAGPLTALTSSPVSATSYTDDSAQAGQTYYYAVTAVNSSGAESAYSNEATAILP
jgi:hypothetical protein